MNNPAFNTVNFHKCKEEIENFSQTIAETAAEWCFQFQWLALIHAPLLTQSLSTGFGAVRLYLFTYLFTKNQLLSTYNKYYDMEWMTKTKIILI